MLVLPFILPMMLGRTYDYNAARAGVSIFSGQTIKVNTLQFEKNFRQSRFRFVKSSIDVSEVLGVKEELALKVMADLVNVNGIGDFLKDTPDRGTTVQLLGMIEFEKMTETMEKNAAPLGHWTNYPKHYLGTHFVRSVTYGGQLVLSLKFKAKSTQEAQDFEAAISSIIGNQATFDATVIVRLKTVQHKLQLLRSMTISYHSTVPLQGPQLGFDGLQSFIANFDKQMTQLGNRKGNPIRVEVVPLNSLDQGIVNFARSQVITSQLKEVQLKYNDVLTAYKELRAWVFKLDRPSKDLMTRINNFLKELTNVKSTFLLAVTKLDVSNQGSVDQFTACLKTYKGAAGFDIPGKYMKFLGHLKEEVKP